MHTSGGISGKRRGPLAAKAAPMGRRYKSRPLRLPATSPMSSALPIPQPRARIFALRARVRGARKRLPSKNGERRPRRLCGGVEEEARPLLCRRRQVHGDGDKASLFSNSHVIDNADSQVNPANSGTSKEQSDDDGDFEETADPANAKKMRRMLSNRESARRSRKRKQTHLTDLESQVSRLTAENTSLLKRLADMTQKYKDATLDNRNHIVDVETMRRKAWQVIK